MITTRAPPGTSFSFPLSWSVSPIGGAISSTPARPPDVLAVVEHRGLVLLALADHDDAVHRDGVEQQPHRVDRGPVGALLVAAPDPARGGKRGVLGGTHEPHGEVAVRPVRHTTPGGLRAVSYTAWRR